MRNDDAQQLQGLYRWQRIADPHARMAVTDFVQIPGALPLADYTFPETDSGRPWHG